MLATNKVTPSLLRKHAGKILLFNCLAIGLVGRAGMAREESQSRQQYPQAHAAIEQRVSEQQARIVPELGATMAFQSRAECPASGRGIPLLLEPNNSAFPAQRQVACLTAEGTDVQLVKSAQGPTPLR